MWKLWPFVPKSVLRLSRELRQAQESLDRLEIKCRRQELRLNELATDLERLSDRLCATQGRLLGGGKGRPRTKGQGELSLDDIPRGDKKALREYFKLHPPTKTTDEPTEH